MLKLKVGYSVVIKACVYIFKHYNTKHTVLPNRIVIYCICVSNICSNLYHIITENRQY